MSCCNTKTIFNVSSESGSIDVSTPTTFEEQVIIDTNNLQALEVRKDGDAGTVVSIDTINSKLVTTGLQLTTSPSINFLMVDSDGAGNATWLNPSLISSINKIQNVGADTGWLADFMTINEQKLRGFTNSVNRIIVDENGLIGIGDAFVAPLTKLHIYEDTVAEGKETGVQIEQDGTGASQIQFHKTNQDVRWVIGQNQVGTGVAQNTLKFAVDESGTSTDFLEDGQRMNLSKDGRLNLNKGNIAGADIELVINPYNGSTDVSCGICIDQTDTTKDSLIQMRSGANIFAFGCYGADAEFRFETASEPLGTSGQTAWTVHENNRMIVGEAPTSPTYNSALTVYESSSVGGTNGLYIEQAGGGDAVVQFLLTGGQKYSIGIDNSDSDRFKIGLSNGFSGANTILTIDPSTKDTTISNKLITSTFQMTTGATNGNILVSDASGNFVSTVPSASGTETLIVDGSGNTSVDTADVADSIVLTSNTAIKGQLSSTVVSFKSAQSTPNRGIAPFELSNCLISPIGLRNFMLSNNVYSTDSGVNKRHYDSGGAFTVEFTPDTLKTTHVSSSTIDTTITGQTTLITSCTNTGLGIKIALPDEALHVTGNIKLTGSMVSSAGTLFSMPTGSASSLLSAENVSQVTGKTMLGSAIGYANETTGGTLGSNIDVIHCTHTAGGISFTLPLISSYAGFSKKIYFINDSADSSDVTINSNTGNFLNNGTDTSLILSNRYNHVSLLAVGTIWYQV